MPNQLTPEQQHALHQWQHETEEQLHKALRLPKRVLGFALVTCLLLLGTMLPAMIDVAHRTHP